jgi:hypothetical protein
VFSIHLQGYNLLDEINLCTYGLVTNRVSDCTGTNRRCCSETSSLTLVSPPTNLPHTSQKIVIISKPERAVQAMFSRRRLQWMWATAAALFSGKTDGWRAAPWLRLPRTSSRRSRNAIEHAGWSRMPCTMTVGLRISAARSPLQR